MNLKEAYKKNESGPKVIRDGICVLIDCGTPEKAKALNDVLSKEVFDLPASQFDAGRSLLGGEVVNCWNVGPYFTAMIDTLTDKAVDYLVSKYNSLPDKGERPLDIQGNDAWMD